MHPWSIDALFHRLGDLLYSNPSHKIIDVAFLWHEDLSRGIDKPRLVILDLLTTQILPKSVLYRTQIYWTEKLKAKSNLLAQF